MNKYWFRPKTYGWGYVPISIEGWIATLGITIVGVFLAYINHFFSPSEISFKSSLFFVVEIIIIGFVFIKLLEKKCKGKLRWHWGNKR